MKNNRINRVDSEIQKHLASIISKFDDSDFTHALISIMKVETYADLSMSKIYVSVFGNDEIKKKTINSLENHPSLIQIITEIKANMATTVTTAVKIFFFFGSRFHLYMTLLFLFTLLPPIQSLYFYCKSISLV